MGKKIDYHIHTWFSDGAASPASIVESAKVLGYDEIAITDHDGTDGISEALEAAKKVGITVIPGIELATETDTGIGLHILGYSIDIENPELVNTLMELREKRERRNAKLLALLSEMGYPLTMADLTLRDGQNFIGKPIIARAMVRKGYIQKPKDAFREGQLLESPKAKTIKKEKLKVDEAIRLIRNAGGYAVLAHPIQIKGFGEKGSAEFYKKVELLVVELKEKGLAGLECYHKDHSNENAAKFVEIAQRQGLCITRGSDFHGAVYE